MVSELKEQPTLNTEGGTSLYRITEGETGAVQSILEENQTLFLAKSIENRYNLEFQLQVITNIQREVLKMEMLLRSVHEKNPEKIVEVIKNNNDSHGLVCYLLDSAFKSYQENDIPLSINVKISDITHSNFLNAVTVFSNRYNNVDSSFLTFEILENEELPNNIDDRKLFFDNLKTLRSKGFKIAIDDVGGRDKEGNLLYSNSDRIDEFIKEGVLDIVKLDMEVVRELYLSSRENYPHTVSFIGEYLKGLENIEIVGEGIEKEFWKTVDGKREMYADGIDYKDFMKFINQYLGVTGFQGYALGKPCNPEDIVKKEDSK